MSEQETFYNNLYDHIGVVLLCLRIALVCLGIWQWKRLNVPLRVFWYYLLAVLGANLLDRAFIWSVNTHTDAWRPYLTRYAITNTNFLAITHRLVDYVFLSWFYSLILPLRWSGGVRRVGWALVAVALFVYIWVDGFQSYGTINSVFSQAFAVALPLLHLWFLYQLLPELNLWKNAYFLISLGLLIENLLGVFVSFVAGKLNYTDGTSFLLLMMSRHLLTVTGLALYAYAFYQARYVRFLPKPA